MDGFAAEQDCSKKKSTGESKKEQKKQRPHLPSSEIALCE